MKAISLLLLLSVSVCFANKSYSQSTHLSLNLKNKLVKEVLREIEKNSEYVFFYYNGVLDENRTVSINIKNQTIDNILDELFKSTDNIYKISDRQIFISKKTELPVIQQQSIEVTGVVTDIERNPLPGVNIVVKGTTNGVISDMDGKYSITVNQPGAILVYSYIGYIPQEHRVEKQSVINVQLSENEEALEEVVVVGYGTQKKSDLTGSIVSIKSDDIKDLNVRSITEALQGRVPGVMINKNSGRAGEGSEIIIRGVGSINGLSPLFIIDGIDRGNSPEYNPKDVESIEVIKDASAAAIYGAKAAGGVVLITTKKGSFNQKTSINVTANYGIRDIAKKYEMLGTADYIRARKEIGEDYPIFHNDINTLPDTDWFGELFETGHEQSYNISINGGGEKVNYYLSGGYEREDGIQKSNYWERFSLRFNSDYKIRKNLTIGTRIYAAKRLQNPETVEVPWRTMPYITVREEDGSFTPIPLDIGSAGDNPVATLSLSHFKHGGAKVDADIYIDWGIIDGLNLLVTGSAGLNTWYEDRFRGANIYAVTKKKEEYFKKSNYSEDFTLTPTLTYAKTFAGKHDLKAMIGFEVKNGYSNWVESRAFDFPVDVAESFYLSTNPNKEGGGSIGRGHFLSQFARLNYSFDNKYLLTANVRRDGSPKFGPNNKWGVFPSISGGWKISEEAFFKNLELDWVTQIKPRISWGILGNDAAIEDFAYQPAYQTMGVHSFDESTVITGYNNRKIINENIKWEEIHSLNFGLDVSLFSNRFNAAFDVYNRETKDMLYRLNTPQSAGINNQMPVNIGSISNKGWELSVSYNNNINDFRYGIGANISHNKNKVINLGLASAYLYDGIIGGALLDSGSPFKTENGLPIGQIWGYATEGMVQSQTQIDALNQKAKEMAVARGEDPTNIWYQFDLTGPGDLLYKDINGDGMINSDDRTYIGNPWPKYQYGINLNMAWKGIDLAIDMVGIAGRDVVNSVKSFEENFFQDFQTTAKIFNASYAFGNGLTSQPAIYREDPNTGFIVKDPNRNYKQTSDYFVENGSYFKIKNITLGYTLPKWILDKMQLSNLRIYFSGQNLITFTKFSGLDPEFSNSPRNHGLYTSGSYPQTKLYSFGLNVGF